MPLLEDIRYFESDSSKKVRPPILLIHGAGSDHGIWPLELRRLDGWRVIAIDLPGHGGSPGAAPASIGEYSQAIWSFINTMGIYHVILAGHSLGGMIAIEMALHEPERISSLILLGVSMHPIRQPELCARLERPPDQQRLLVLLEKILFSPGCDPLLKKTIMKSLAPARLSLLCSDWKLALNHEPPDDLHAIRCPVLVVSGADDRMAPPSGGRALAELMPSAQFEVIPKAGHALLVEQPEEVGGRILSFLEKIGKR